jgi:acyl-CoA thioester hydrolase
MSKGIVELKASKTIDIRFSEVDSMGVVWHGSYTLYFEDAREAFGEKYGLDYMTIYNNGFYAPLVELTFNYKRPLRYGSKARVDIVYRPTEAAKIVFDYEIYDEADGSLVAMGHSVQVFMDDKYQLVWDNPPFYQQWKEKAGFDLNNNNVYSE